MSDAQSSPPHPAPRSLFLLYHELRSTPSAFSYVMSTAAFKDHLSLFRSPHPAGSLIPEITFDDGHLSNLTEALPLLQAHQLSAHFFITAGWTGRKSGFMKPSDVRELHATGQHIGAHGYTHKLLTHCSPAELDQELRVARLDLEAILGTAVTTMSLPGGRSSKSVLDACRAAGYTQVFTSQPKAEPDLSAPSLGRLNLRGDATADWLAQVLDPATGALHRLERTARLKAAAKQVLGDTAYRRLWSLLNREEPGAPDQEDLAS